MCPLIQVLPSGAEHPRQYTAILWGKERQAKQAAAVTEEEVEERFLCVMTTENSWWTNIFFFLSFSQQSIVSIIAEQLECGCFYWLCEFTWVCSQRDTHTHTDMCVLEIAQTCLDACADAQRHARRWAREMYYLCAFQQNGGLKPGWKDHSELFWCALAC